MKQVQLLILAFLSITVIAQTNQGDISEELVVHFEHDRTAFHIQTNKTIFFAGEEIWFSAYAFNRHKGEIILEDKNVVVQLWDNNQELLDTSLLLLTKGTQSGSFLLKPTLAEGIYTITASSTDNRMPAKDQTFGQTIKVINPESEKVAKSSTSNKYDIQLLPEGGHLVAGINNTCGIKILNDSGKGVQLSDLVLKDSKGNIIQNSLKTNRLGMGKFSFTPALKTAYHIEVNDNKVTLPEINTYGITLNSNQNFNTGDLNIKLEANDATLKRLANTEISVIIHKDKSSQVYTVNFEADYPEITFQIPNKKLYPGVNVITVFNAEKEPLLERLFFNHKSVQEMQSFVAQTSKVKDTFTYSIVNKIDQRPIRSTTSISVLPATNSAMMNKESIYASVYLKPYLNGSVEDPSYYFTRNSYQKQFEIDLLLLNQGWSKYNWKQVFNSNKSTALAQVKKPGISLNGYVRAHNDKDIPTQVLLYSNDNKNLSVEDLDEEARFVLDSLPFAKGTKLNFSALDRSGKPVMANFFYTVNPRAATFKTSKNIASKDYFTANLIEPTKSIFSNEPEQLKEVVVNANTLKYEKFFKGWDGRKITATEKSKGNLRNFMASYGYYVIFDEDSLYRRFGKWVMNMNGRGSAFREPRVVVDGIGYKAMDIGEMVSLQDVDEIYADRRGKTHTFIVFTNGKWASNSDEKTSKSFTLKEGFTPKKEFYTPQYTSYTSEEYQKYGVVSWHERVEPNSEGYSQIELVNPSGTDLLFYTEGYSETGKPIASVVKVEVNSGN